MKVSNKFYSCWLLAVGCWRLDFSCWLLAFSCWLLSSNIQLNAENNNPPAKSYQLSAKSYQPSDSTLDNQEFIKTINKTFPASNSTVVLLSNKYGKIIVKPGSGAEVVITIRITARCWKQEEADKIFNTINIAFSNGPDFVKAETQIENSHSWWKGSGSSDYSIDYDVAMPADCKLELINKYGDSQIGAMNKDVKIVQHYGNFKIESAHYAEVDLAYGSGNITKLEGLNGVLAYAKIFCGDLKDVQLKSKYSEMQAGNINTLNTQSAYDDYKIKNVNAAVIDARYGAFDFGEMTDVRLSSSYTDFKVQKLLNSADLRTTYGEIRIDDVKSGFGTIDIFSNYTDCFVGLDKNISYQIDASMNYASMNRPQLISTKLDNTSGSRREIVGTVGDAGTKSLLRVRLNYGGLKLK